MSDTLSLEAVLQETENLREQQRAISDVLRALARAEGLQPVLDEVMRAATRLSRGRDGTLYVLKGNLLHAVSRSGDEDPETWEFDRNNPHALDRTTIVGRAALTRAPVHSPDFLEDPEYEYEGPRKGYRALLGVPIVFEDELIGGMTIARAEPEPYSDEEIALVEAFANQAAIALANARLLDTVEQQLEEQQAVGHTLRAVAEGGGLQPVLDAIVEAAKRLCRGEHAQLYLVEGDYLRIFSQTSHLHGYDFAVDHPHERDPTTVVGRVWLTGKPEQIPDVLADPDYAYEGQKLVGYRALLGVPIAKEGEFIGAIAVGRDEPGAFADDLVELVKTFADEAAVAIANARLLEAVERQLGQQRAVADILRSVARSEGLEAVFNVVADSATRLCQGDYAALYLKENDTLVVAANRYRQPDVHEYERENPHPIDRHTAIGRAAITREVVHIPDTHEDPEYAWGASQIVEYRSLLAAPILLDDELIGAMNVVKVAPEPFAPEHVDLIRTFADQAAIAIANARLLDAVERQLEQQSSISDVFSAVARAEGLDVVFREAVAAATRLCAGQYGGLYLLKEGVFEAQAHFGPAEMFEYERDHPQVIDRNTMVGRVALTGDVVHIPDLNADPEYEWNLLLGHRAGLAVPIFVEDELIGAIAVTREPEPFTEDQVELVKTFANQAAIAIRNARLMEAVERQLDEQRAVAEVLDVVARAGGLDAVFNAVVEAAVHLCDAEYGALYLEEDGAFPAVVAGGPGTILSDFERENPIRPGRETLVGRIALLREAAHIPDVLEDREYRHPRQDEVGLRALAGAPIFVEDELIGVVAVARNVPERFSDEQIGLIKTFADQAAIAITNARLLEMTERQRAELSRFVSPQVAELVSSDEGRAMLGGHRAYVSSMFFDLRGFTSFTELAEPEELFEVLREYHVALGDLIPRYEGTLEHFAGDGLMVFFNDPIPVEDHERKAIELALTAQERFDELAVSWRKRGHELGLGIGIAAGYATLGRIGFEGRYDYGVLGTVTNLASRLSSAAEPGQTLISQRVYAAVDERCDAVEVGALELKGFGRPVLAYDVRGLRDSSS